MSARRALLALALAAALTGWAGRQLNPTHVAPAARLHFYPQSTSFVSPSLGWAWGPARWPVAGQPAGGVLAETVDGGRDWSGVLVPGRNYADPGFGPGFSGVRFANARRGYLFGSQLLVTDDGGSRWRRIPVAGRILDVEIAAGRAYALGLNCANAGDCYTADLYRIGPRTLARVIPQTAVSAFASLAARGHSVYLLTPSLVGLGSSLWASHNSGRSWETFRAPCEWPGAGALTTWSPFGLALACGSQPAAGSQAKMFYASTNGGRTWRLVGRIRFSPGYVSSLAAAGVKTWVLGEARGQIEASTDGGRRWQPARFSGAAAGVEGWGTVNFIDRLHGVAVPWTLNGDVLAFTSDGGRSWRNVAFGWKP